MQILRPKRRIDILRDVEEAANKGRPYVITFCGVNGVGKSTNLAKVSSRVPLLCMHVTLTQASGIGIERRQAPLLSLILVCDYFLSHSL